MSSLFISLSSIHNFLLEGKSDNLYDFVLARAIELAGNGADCLEFLEAIGFKFNDVKGKTVWIMDYRRVDGVIDYNKVLTKVVLPKTKLEFNQLWEQR